MALQAEDSFVLRYYSAIRIASKRIGTGSEGSLQAGRSGNHASELRLSSEQIPGIPASGATFISEGCLPSSRIFVKGKQYLIPHGHACYDQSAGRLVAANVNLRTALFPLHPTISPFVKFRQFVFPKQI